MKRLFTNLLLFYILGIVIFYFVSIPTNIVCFLCLSSIFFLSYNIIKSRLNQSLLLCFFFILGISISFVHESSNLEEFIDKEIHIEAVIDGRDKKTAELEKYIINIKKVNNKKITSEKSILTIIGEKDIKLGSTIIIKTTPKIPLENSNPGLFNYRTYLKGKKINTIMTANTYDIKDIDSANIPIRYRIKESAIKTINESFKPYLNEANNSLINSIILGDTDYLNETNVKLYRDMGLSHILAVSGLHIGIVSSFLMFVISRLGIKRKTNVLITLAFIWSYGFLIGYPPSILRASLLFSFLYLSKIVHRPYDSIDILSLAALILLIMNPYSLFSVGFQLSFIASASILLFSDKISLIFYPIKGKLVDTVSTLFAVNIGVLPIQAYYFNRISILGFVANILIVPILSFSLVIAFAMIAVELMMPVFNSILGPILNWSLNLQFSILKILEKIPINIIKVFSPEIISIIFLYGLLLILFGFIDVKSFGKNVEKTVLVYLLILILFNVFNMEENMEIHFIDVGQGDSIYIRSGKKNLLIDTGGSIFKNNNIPERILIPYLEKKGVSKLDAVFISHFHEDHCQGLPLILENFDVENIFISHTPSDPYLNILDDSRLTYLKKGDKIIIDKNTNFDVLWPIDNMEYDENLNNKSMVGILKYKDRKIMFTGDMEQRVEKAILEDLEEVDILKVGHHGSNTSSTEEFLEATNPKIGVISVGRNNIYKHPDRQVLDRFGQETKLFRTDENGLVKMLLEKDIEVLPYLFEGEKLKWTIEDYIFKNYNYFIYNLLFILVSYILVGYSIEEEFMNDL